VINVAQLFATGIRNKLLSLSRLDQSPHGAVVVVTYEGLRNYRQSLLQVFWSAVCVDEGQKIRNPAAEITSVCKLLSSHHRILLSGTPIQNVIFNAKVREFCKFSILEFKRVVELI
jgi:hypothetical protein